MLRTLPIILAGFLLVFPAVAAAQSSGLDAYTENPPAAGGNGGAESASPPAPGAGTGSRSGVAGEADDGGASPGAGAGTGAGSLTEAEAGRRSNGQRAGELPATGLDQTGLMALLGISLLFAGLGVRRVLPPVA